VPDEDTPWYIQLLISLAVMVGVAALIGGILAVGGVTVANLLNVSSSPSRSSESASIPVSSASSPSTPTVSQSPDGTAAPDRPPRSPHHHSKRITLTASPAHVPSYGRIDLKGSYAAPDGTMLQVQRAEPSGAWLDFPTTTSVNGGSFSTYIMTSHIGTNRLRVLDPITGRTSNVVTVRVG
jgi:hypothetical protein